MTSEQSITLQQIRNAISTYCLPAFSPSTAIGAVSVSSGKADEVANGFKKMGFDVELKELPMLNGDEGENESGEGEDDGNEEEDGTSGTGEVDEGVEEPMEGVTSP